MCAKPETDGLCGGCVYYPPNLPRQHYAEADWQVLQAMTCACSCLPASEECLASRKTHCSLVDLRKLSGT